MPAFSRICQNIACLAALSLIALPLASLTAQANTGTRKSKPLSGTDIRKLISGASVHIDTPLGSVIPVNVGADGSLSGTAGNVAFYLGSKSDRGRWWISGSKLCQKWNIWFDRKSNCMIVRQKGSRLFWRDNDGDTGSATIVSRPITAAKPKKKSKPKKFTAIAYGLGFPPTFKGHVGIPQNGLGDPPVPPKRTSSAAEFARNADAPASTPTHANEALSKSTPAHRTSSNTTFRVVRVAANDTLNLRHEPSIVSPIVGTITANATGIRLSGACHGTWCRVTYKGESGWASRDFLVSEGAPNPTHETRQRNGRYKVVRVSDHDVLNVRDQPSADTRIAGTIPADARGIRIIGACLAEWCPIAHGPRRGWVNRHYISPVRLPSKRLR